MKKYWKKFFMSAVAQHRWKAAVSGNTLPHNLPNLKNKFPVKCILKYICLTFSKTKGP